MNPRAQGLLLPLQRDKKRDFAFGCGAALWMSQVRQVLLVDGPSVVGPGEMPWRTEFGSALYLLRHAPCDATTQALAQTYVAEAFTRWLPELRLRHVQVKPRGPALQISIHFADPAQTAHHLQLDLGGTNAEL